METPVLFFYAIGNYVGIPYSIKKPCRAGSRSGGKVDVAYSDPPQAENPAKQDSFLLYRKDRLWRSLELKNARTEAGTTTRRFLD